MPEGVALSGGVLPAFLPAAAPRSFSWARDATGEDGKAVHLAKWARLPSGSFNSTGVGLQPVRSLVGLGAMLGRLPPERPEALPDTLLRNIFELLVTIKPQIEVFE